MWKYTSYILLKFMLSGPIIQSFKIFHKLLMPSLGRIWLGLRHNAGVDCYLQCCLTWTHWQWHNYLQWTDCSLSKPQKIFNDICSLTYLVH